MKDDSFLSIISETIARGNPQVAALLDRNNRIMADLKKQHQSEMKKLEQEKSERLVKFLKEFAKRFEQTPKVEREELIKVNEANLEQLRIEAKLLKQSGQINECEEKLSILKEFYSLIDKIPFNAKESEVLSEKNQKLSFNLVSEASGGLNNLRKTLIDKKLINKVEPHDFKSIFYTVLETKPVDWKIKGEMKYFVQQLCKKEELFNSSPDNYYVIASTCFTVAGQVVTNKELGGVHLTKNMKSRRIIDQAIEELLISSDISAD